MTTTAVPRPYPARAVRAKTPAEKAFVALGPVAEEFIKGAAASGVTTLAADLIELCDMEAAHDREALPGRHRAGCRVRTVPGHRRALHPGCRHRCSPAAASPGDALIVDLPVTETRSLGDYAIGERVMSTSPPPLPVDLEAGLRRLRLGAMRALSPELLVVAKTQRWKPEEFLRTLIEAEIASRDASNARGRLKAAAFPVRKTLDEFDVEASSVPRATFDYLASLEWVAA